MAIAMTVGATKIRMLQESALASMQEAFEPQPQQQEAASDPKESCFT